MPLLCHVAIHLWMRRLNSTVLLGRDYWSVCLTSSNRIQLRTATNRRALQDWSQLEQTKCTEHVQPKAPPIRWWAKSNTAEPSQHRWAVLQYPESVQDHKGTQGNSSLNQASPCTDPPGQGICLPLHNGCKQVCLTNTVLTSTFFSLDISLLYPRLKSVSYINTT